MRHYLSIPAKDKVNLVWVIYYVVGDKKWWDSLGWAELKIQQEKN